MANRTRVPCLVALAALVAACDVAQGRCDGGSCQAPAPRDAGPGCPSDTEQRVLGCDGGLAGERVESRASSCGADGGRVWGDWTLQSDTCMALRACSFGGQQVPHGASVTAYATSSVGLGQRCGEQQRTCVDGVLTGTYLYASCAAEDAGCAPAPAQQQTLGCPPGQSGTHVQTRTSSCPPGAASPVWGAWMDVTNTCAGPASCTFDGRVVPSGGTVTAYLAATVPAGSTCQAQTRTCTDGGLSGSYAFPSCSSADAGCTPLADQTQTLACPAGTSGAWEQTRTSSCPAGASAPVWSAWVDTTNTCAATGTTCTFGGATVANGASVTAYLTASVPAGQSCTSQQRTCTNGALSGSYVYAACSPAAPTCTPDAPQTRTLQCPSGQSGSWVQTRTSSCPAGASSPVWSTWADTTNTCAASSCTFGAVTVPNGASVVAYQAATAPAGQRCARETRACVNGVLSGSFTVPACAAAVPTTQVKNLITFQVGGWGGVTTDLPGADLEWPAYGGMSAYRARSQDILAHQAELIAGLGSTVAVAVLLMTDSDSVASGYGACWDGSWSGGPGCDSGTLRRPFAVYDELREAARAQGVRYAPDFSLMNYDGVRGAQVLPKLQAAIAWWRQRLPDPFAARAPSGRYYVVLDSLPSQLGLSASDLSAALAWMHAQTDIEWIDNMFNASTPPGNTNYTGNVFHSTWGDEATKDYLNGLEGDHFLWWFQATWVVRTFADFNLVANKVPEATRLKWLNISPHTPSKYPVNISQWNEYAEYLIFEPSTRSGTANYDYLRWRLSQQP